MRKDPGGIELIPPRTIGIWAQGAILRRRAGGDAGQGAVNVCFENLSDAHAAGPTSISDSIAATSATAPATGSATTDPASVWIHADAATNLPLASKSSDWLLQPDDGSIYDAVNGWMKMRPGGMQFIPPGRSSSR
jgi:hypothetical protein